MASAKQRSASDGTRPYEAALRKAFQDLAEARNEEEQVNQRLRAARERITELTALVNHLLNLLPKERRAAYRHEVRELGLHKGPQTQGGPVYDNVIELFSSGNRREWTVSDVQYALDEGGKSAEPKAVYNVLNYLARKGQLRRISRGRYHIVGLGIGIETSDELDVGDLEGRMCTDE